MVATQQDLGDNVTAKFGGTSVLWKLQNPIPSRKGIVPAALLITQHTWYHSDCGVDYNHRSHFPSVEDVVADTQFDWVKNIDDALIKTFVTTAEQNHSIHLRDLFYATLVESIALGCR